jgi:hypothetical protein
MTAAQTNPVYYALRVSDEAVAPEWWAAAHAHSHEAPQPVKALLAGRSRVEVSAAEAAGAIHWAAQLSGWTEGGQHPLFVYPSLG